MRQIHAHAVKPGNTNSGTGEWLTRREVAARLKKTPRTIDSYARKGFLPHIKVGRTIMFRWPDVEKYLIENFGVFHPKEKRNFRSNLTGKPKAPCGPAALQREPGRIDH